MSYACLARLYGWVAESNFSGWYETSKKVSFFTGTGIAVSRRHATDEDLSAFIKLWGGRFDLDTWLRNVRRLPNLAENEVARIERIVVRHRNAS